MDGRNSGRFYVDTSRKIRERNVGGMEMYKYFIFLLRLQELYVFIKTVKSIVLIVFNYFVK